jgi:DNA-binding response OmpR family regulator
MDSRGVLLLCQSEATLSALASILVHGRETIVTYRDLLEAWEHVKNGKVGCVVLDAQEPAADALAFFRAARSTAKTCDIPFLFLISDKNVIPELGSFGPELAPDAWLLLPCTSEQFLKLVRAMLAHKKGAPPLPSVVSTLPLLEKSAGRRSSAALGPATEAPPAPHKSSDTTALVGHSPEELLSGPGAVFSGRLGVLDVTKIVSMVEPLRLTGVLRLTDGKRQGQVHFVEGAVRHAELLEMQGPDALFLLFHLKTGAFRFDLEPATSAHTIEGNTMSLLLEGLRQMDEAKAMVKQFRQRRASAAAQPAQASLAAAPAKAGS